MKKRTYILSILTILVLISACTKSVSPGELRGKWTLYEMSASWDALRFSPVDNFSIVKIKQVKDYSDGSVEITESEHKYVREFNFLDEAAVTADGTEGTYTYDGRKGRIVVPGVLDEAFTASDGTIRFTSFEYCGGFVINGTRHEAYDTLNTHTLKVIHRYSR